MVKRVRQDWLEIAREMLIKGGVEAVTVQSMSQRLGVTRGGFYGYFGSRDALLERLLKDWQEVNTRALRRIAARDRKDGETQFKELIEMWVEDEDYSPQYDSAVRDWARRSPEIARKVHKVDDERIDLIETIFRNLGFKGTEAQVRARITYYHQVGYYALAVHETRPARRRLSPTYTLILAGRQFRQKSRFPSVRATTS
jgi:AcrR family transcriptional regulator